VIDAMDVSGGYLRLDIVSANARDAEGPPRAANDDPHHQPGHDQPGHDELDSAGAQG
jgi:hypothetical protein